MLLEVEILACINAFGRVDKWVDRDHQSNEDLVPECIERVHPFQSWYEQLLTTVGCGLLWRES